MEQSFQKGVVLHLASLIEYTEGGVISILNLSTAVRACGAFAGNTILSPAFTVNRVPFTVIFTTPSNTCTSALTFQTSHVNI